MDEKQASDFDVRAFALQKAVDVKGYPTSGETVAVESVIDAAEKFYGFLSGESTNEKEQSA